MRIVFENQTEKEFWMQVYTAQISRSLGYVRNKDYTKYAAEVADEAVEKLRERI